MTDDIAIKVEGVSKTFKLPHEKHTSLKSALINFGRTQRGYEKQEVLKDITFEVKKGDFFGIVGRNGSGKSTLLKLISQIYTPDKGTITINGKLTPFIELGVGFNPELSGRENVFLNGALLGFNRKEMEAMYDDIVEFAELERFMDQKLKNYSSGMQVRLAFSIAIRANTDILVLDEVLAVGDEAFQRKCYEYFARLKKDKKTVVLVTHSMDNIIQFCTKAMLVDKGHKTEISTPRKIARRYRELNNEDGISVTRSRTEEVTKSKYVEARASVKKEDGKIRLDIALKPLKATEDPIVAIGIFKDSGEQVYRWASDEKVPHKFNIDVHDKICIEIDDMFPVGKFSVDMFVKKGDRSMDYAIFNGITSFNVKNKSPYQFDTYWKIPEKTYINGKEI